MAQRTERNGRRKNDIKGPLVISTVLAVVAFLVVTVAASGGTDNGARTGLGLIAGGVAFIGSVIMCSTLMLLDKPNDPELGKGTGVNRSSAKIFAENKARRQAEARQAQAGSSSAAASDPRDSAPTYGQRVHPDTQGEEPGASAR